MFILDTDKHVIGQSVKTQMKCRDLHCLLRLKHSSGTEVHHFIEFSICYTWTTPYMYFVVSICLGHVGKIHQMVSQAHICFMAIKLV